VSLFPPDLTHEAEALLDLFRKRGLTLATAESCTGGLAAALLTSIAGSSDVLDRGFVTYSNSAKTEMTGVPSAVIADHGAVSEATARAMAEGAISHSAATIAVSVTGVAGPGGGTAAKPVGRVHIACARRHGTTTHVQLDLPGQSREAIRLRSVAEMLRQCRLQALAP
jgi:nicotinamide-nucleotide amidase